MPDLVEGAATEAAVVTAKAVENAVGDVQGVVAAAVEKVAAAEQTAQVLADAALMTELGRRIGDVERGLSECLANFLALKVELAGVTAGLANLSAQVALLTPPIVTLPGPSETTEKSLSPIPPKAPVLEIVDPLKDLDAGNGDGQKEASIKRRVRNVI
jgi:hypothetical protein